MCLISFSLIMPASFDFDNVYCLRNAIEFKTLVICGPVVRNRPGLTLIVKILFNCCVFFPVGR